MDFALLGVHPEGLEMARALVASGRYSLRALVGTAADAETLTLAGFTPPREQDLEEVLADPKVELVIVASPLRERFAMLRRALQSERHVLCVSPATSTSDSAYEAGLIQNDTGKVLLSLRAEALHPGVRRLAELAHQGFTPETFFPSLGKQDPEVDPLIGVVSTANLPPEFPRLIELEIASTDAVLRESDTDLAQLGIPAWDVLRLLGGEIVEVSAFSPPSELEPDEVVLLTGRYLSGALFRVMLFPRAAREAWSLTVVRAHDRLRLSFPEGWPSQARLEEIDGDAIRILETYEPFAPWQALVAEFDAVQAMMQNSVNRSKPGAMRSESVARPGSLLGWIDEIRAIELDHGCRRSIEYRRAFALEYPEAAEEASFKGTMTLFGCTLLWLSIALLILSVWVPWLGWIIAPAFAVFVVLQFFRFAIPKSEKPTSDSSGHATTPIE